MRLSTLLFLFQVHPHALIKVVTVPRFVEPEVKKSTVFLRIKDSKSPPLENITSCMWIASELESHGSVWSTGNPHFRTYLSKSRRYVTINGVASRFEYPPHYKFSPEKWIFHCFSLHGGTKNLQVFFDGEKVLERSLETALSDFGIKENFLMNDTFADAYSFAGEFSDLNIWSTVLTSEDISQLYDCKKILNAPDILDWTNVEFDMHPNITIVNRAIHPCHEKDNLDHHLLVIPTKVSMDDKYEALRTCDAFGGLISLPQSKEQLLELGGELKKHLDICRASYWVPIFKGKTENEWFDENHLPAEYSRWQKGQPNGFQYETCAGISRVGTDEVAYFDTLCDRVHCLYCEVVDFKPFLLKGLSNQQSLVIDRQYVFRPLIVKNGWPVWIGFTSSIISWNASSKIWQISNRFTGDILASMC